MNLIKRLFIMTLLSTFSLMARGELYAISSVDEILPFVKQGTYIFWDLDRTVMIASSKNLFPPRLVEAGLPKLISELQLKGFKIIALSRRGTADLSITLTELNKLGIDFSKTAPSTDIVDIAPGVTYQNGIIFTTRQEKGPALKAFLSQIHFVSSFSSVLLIDDQWFNIVSVDQTTKELQVTFDGFYYRRVDISDGIVNPQDHTLKVKIGDFPIENHHNFNPRQAISQTRMRLISQQGSQCTDLFK